MGPAHSFRAGWCLTAIRAAAAFLLAATTSNSVVCAQEPAATALPALRLIRVVPSSDGGSTTVVLEADGPLPEPEGDSLGNPPRVFLDLHGVVAAPTLTRSGRDPLVVRARVARHSDAPLVTRVVFDLSRVSGFRVDASARAEGRLVLTLGAGAMPSAPTVPAPAASPTPSQPMPPQPQGQSSVAGRSNRRPARVAPSDPLRTPRLAPGSRGRGTPAARAEAYAAQLSALVDRLQALRPVLESIDRRAEVTADLNAAAAEFEAVGRILMAIKPTAGREATHALLQRACALGARASRTLQDASRAGDATGEWNAASAAAGALLLLDRAIKEMG
jgi:hypothetical protein